MRRQSVPAVRDPGAVGLIGLGEIGQVHAAAVRRSRSARLVAVADTMPDLLAPFEARGMRGYHHGPPGTFDDEIEITGSDATLRPRGRDQARRSAPWLAVW